MSTPLARTAAPRDPFKLLKAILIGTALGLIVVMLVPYVLPLDKAGSRLAYKAPTSKASSLARPAARLPAAPKASEDGSAAGKPLPETVTGPGDDVRSAPAGQPPVRGDQEPEAVARPQDRDGVPEVPAAPAESGRESVKAEPILIPAVEVKYPKPFTDADMTKALQPLLSFKLSEEDAAAVKEAISAKGDREAAAEALKKIANPAARAFAEWRRLRSSSGVEEAMAFRKAHPLFPEPPLDAGIEKSLFLSNTSSAEILAFYRNRAPQTGLGKASLGAALIEAGERERGLNLIRFAWSRYFFDQAVQERFISRFGALLNGDDEMRRKRLLAVRLKQQDAGKSGDAGADEGGLKRAVRFRGKKGKGHVLHGGRHGKRWKRAGRAKGRRNGALQGRAFERQALAGKAHAFAVASLADFVQLKKSPPLAGDPSAAKGDSQPAVQEPGSGDERATPEPDAKKGDAKEKPTQGALQSKAAEGSFNLRKERSGGPSALLARLKALRREGSDDDVWSLLRSIDPAEADLADPDRWWDFRRSEIRRALADEHPKTAYAIAVAHGPLDDDNRSEAEFMAGWIALRFLKDPARAQPHFEASRGERGSARDETRAAYWLARTKLEQGLPGEAQAFFAEAANHSFTYYGALALQALRKGTPCEFRAPPAPAEAAIASFVNDDAFKAVMIAKQLDMQPILVAFFLDLARQVQDPTQMTLLLELAERVAPPHVAIRAAKIALFRGFATEAYAFPTLLPKFDPAAGNVKVEPALLNALTRQESEFHTGSISIAGARGLMQLMPQTAKLVAAANKMKYEPARLISDPSYNVTLGSAFLAQLITGYGGSYVLSLAAYNAGPGRVAQWIDDFGDPRDKAIDPVDWIERIPFAETRNYVQRILESTQLYRCRFEEGKAQIRIFEDLHRGRPGKIPDFAGFSGSAEMDQTP